MATAEPAQHARLRLAVIGHVEHVTIGRAPALPGAGDIVHLESPHWFPGGGGGVAFSQLVKSSAEVHLLSPRIAGRQARRGSVRRGPIAGVDGDQSR